jgi:hypothetical protein
MENDKFVIDQLRQDKIIYATEACATILICLFGFFFSNQYLSAPFKDYINISTFSNCDWLYFLHGNRKLYKTYKNYTYAEKD